ncbi:hypothetical protein NKR23_g6690 [Pleurostoma richardsiae]|uniref:Uncharacterized protein n=1 Tax=Pleurostoma richardsiae TaxID=41990 RepID=A0AA38RDH9_9PEZI|nr:hypothetical protein NKR23_g6690 [Pleurostoma richardsiae]
MCRMMVFKGTCTRCGEFFEWKELSQELSCLEAKNNGVFGECRRGIAVEEHSFDQECDACAEDDEGFGELEEEAEEEDENAQIQAGGSKGGGDAGGKGKGKERQRDRYEEDVMNTNKRQRVS